MRRATVGLGGRIEGRHVVGQRTTVTGLRSLISELVCMRSLQKQARSTILHHHHHRMPRLQFIFINPCCLMIGLLLPHDQVSPLVAHGRRHANCTRIIGMMVDISTWYQVRGRLLVMVLPDSFFGFFALLPPRRSWWSQQAFRLPSQLASLQDSNFPSDRGILIRLPS